MINDDSTDNDYQIEITIGFFEALKDALNIHADS